MLGNDSRNDTSANKVCMKDKDVRMLENLYWMGEGGETDKEVE